MSRSTTPAGWPVLVVDAALIYGPTALLRGWFAACRLAGRLARAVDDNLAPEIGEDP